MDRKQPVQIANGVINAYVDPDHKVPDMAKLQAGIIQAITDAYKQGTSDTERLIGVLTKVGRDTERLDRQLATLASRIEPFEENRMRPEWKRQYIPEIQRPENVAAMADAVGEMRNALDNMERDLAALRAKIDAMESGGYLKDELGPWMKETDASKKVMVELEQVPACKLNISDEQFRAIGHVVLQWAFLEAEIDREIDWLNEWAERPDECVKFGAKFENRAAGWRTLAEIAYEDHPKLVADVVAISERAVAIKGERDSFVHCNLSSSGTVFRIRKAKIIELLDTGTPAHIEDLACRIAGINAALFEHHDDVNRLFDGPL